MDNKTILRMFGEAFLRSMIVLIGIIIIGFILFFVIKANSSNKTETDRVVSQATTEEITTEVSTTEISTTEAPTTEEPTTEEITTEELTTEEQVILSIDKKILVLNSTNVAGLAKAWMDRLKQDGFADVATGNYSAGTETNTRIYVSEEGMGTDLTDYFADATVEVGILSSGIDVSTEGVEIFVVIGSNDTATPQ